MHKILLLPESFKANGLIMIMVGFTGALVATQNGLINIYRLVSPGKILTDGSYPYPTDFWYHNQILTNISIALMVVGLLSFFLSRERDEFYYKVRLESIQFAILTQLAVAITLFGFFSLSESYQLQNTITAILTISFAGFWATFLLRYYYVVLVKADKDPSI
jgi:hypothetical protein